MATYPSPILQDVTVEGALTGPGVDAVVAPLLTSATAASTYETQTSAASTYETQANATATYETIASAASTYTAQADLASTATGKGSKLVAFIQRITGAVARWVEDKLSETVSVKDFGAVADAVTLSSSSVSIASGSAALTVTGASFTSADVGKAIGVDGAGTSGGVLTTTIAGYTSATQVTLTATASTALSAVAAKVAYGADNTNAFQLALNYSVLTGDIPIVPIGNYALSSAISAVLGTAGGGLRGKNMYASKLITLSGTAGIASFSGHAVVAENLYLTSGVTQNAGYLLSTSCANETYKLITVDGYYNGINATGNLGTMRDLVVINNHSASSVGVLVNGYLGGIDFDNVFTFKGTLTPTAGMKIVSSGAVQISNSNLINSGTDLLIAPGAGQTVASVNLINTFLDTAVHGLVISPTGGGNVNRCAFTQMWCSSHSGAGVIINATGGTVNGVQIVAPQINFNGSDGITIVGSGCSNIDISGGEAVGNTGAGFSLGNSASAVRIRGLFSGSGYGGSGNGYGAYINAGVTGVVVDNCTFSGNTTNFIDASGAATIRNCTGYVSANTGISDVPNTLTSVVVTHGLSGTPSASDIQITPGSAWGSNPLYVDSTTITLTQFTVKCASAAAGNLYFAWRATCAGVS